MPQIVLSTKGLFAQNIGCQIQVGILEDNGYLTNITSQYGSSLSIDLQQGNALIFKNNGLYLQATSLKTIIFKLDYSDVDFEIVNFFSLWSFPAATYPNRYDVATAMQKYLPEGLYDLDPVTGIPYLKNYGIGAVFEDLWTDILNTIQTLYPPFTSDNSWEKELNNGYPWSNSFNYNMVIQIINNLSFYSANIYDTSLLISQYIYARIGQSYYVYIEETAQNIDTWALDVSLLDIDTFLGEDEFPNKCIIHIQASSLPSDFITDLNAFIKKILPLDVSHSIELNPDFSVFGLILSVQDTYEEDPRLGYKYAILYNFNTMYDASALITPYSPAFITSYVLSPPSQTFATSDPPFEITAVVTYTYEGVDYPVDVTDESFYSSDNPAVISLDFNEATINDNGIANISGTFLDQQTTVQYTVANDSWELGDSYLGIDTILG